MHLIVEILCIFIVLHIAITSLIMRKKKLLFPYKKENHSFLDYEIWITAFCLDYRKGLLIVGSPERGIKGENMM